MDELAEQQKITRALAELMPADRVQGWLHTPNARLAGLAPFYCLCRGWIDRVWEAIDTIPRPA